MGLGGVGGGRGGEGGRSEKVSDYFGEECVNQGGAADRFRISLGCPPSRISALPEWV